MTSSYARVCLCCEGGWVLVGHHIIVFLSICEVRVFMYLLPRNHLPCPSGGRYTLAYEEVTLQNSLNVRNGNNKERHSDNKQESDRGMCLISSEIIVTGLVHDLGKMSMGQGQSGS